MRTFIALGAAVATLAACGGGDPGPIASGGSVADAVAAVNAQSTSIDAKKHADPRIVNDGATTRMDAQALPHADPRIVND